VHFTVFSNQSVGYVLQSNSTVKYFKGSFQDPVTFFAVPMINAVGRAIAQFYANSSTDKLLTGNNMLLTGESDNAGEAAVLWRPRLGKFPHPSLESGGMQLQGQILAVFIFASLMFGCVSQVGLKFMGIFVALAVGGSM
jgi:small-conductance mechanosensitive channel